MMDQLCQRGHVLYNSGHVCVQWTICSIILNSEREKLRFPCPLKEQQEISRNHLINSMSHVQIQ